MSTSGWGYKASGLRNSSSMNSQSNKSIKSKSKSRPVARDDWAERADVALKSLWANSPLNLEQSVCNRIRKASLPSPRTPDTPGHRERAKSEDSSAFAQAIKDSVQNFTLNPQSRFNGPRLGSLPAEPTQVQTSTSQLGLFNNDASLKHARRRIRLASDFDEMLQKGFPKLSLRQEEPEFTLYISLTPKVATQPLARATSV